MRTSNEFASRPAFPQDPSAAAASDTRASGFEIASSRCLSLSAAEEVRMLLSPLPFVQETLDIPLCGVGAHVAQRDHQH